jgi:hypothetical protein
MDEATGDPGLGEDLARIPRREDHAPEGCAALQRIPAPESGKGDAR